MTFQETYDFACGSILVGKLSVPLRALAGEEEKEKEGEKRNIALRIVKFTVSLKLHLDQCHSQCD